MDGKNGNAKVANGHDSKNAPLPQQIQMDLQDLLQEMLTSKKMPLQYEKLEGYKIPPRTQFSMLKKPAVTIKNGTMVFNMACIRTFKSVQHIVPMIDPDSKKIAVVPCAEEEGSSVEWARYRARDNELVNKDVTCKDFVNSIYALMGWSSTTRYKVLGRLSNSERGLILVFELEEAIRFEVTAVETNPETGKKVKHEVKYYPAQYEHSIGKDYNDYKAARLGEKFEKLDEYEEGIPGESAVIVQEAPDELIPDEVKEEITAYEESGERGESGVS